MEIADKSIHYEKNYHHADIPLSETAVNRGLRAIISVHEAGHMSLPLKNTIPDRKNFLDNMKIDSNRVMSCIQTHSMDVVLVKECSPGIYMNQEADGLVTSLPKAILSVTVADCLPVFIWSRDASVFCLLHSGWKGTGIVKNALSLIRERFGLGPGSLDACIGPGIGNCCYAVDQARYREFCNAFGDECGRREKGQYFLDLHRANIMMMEDAGVASCTVIADCTHCTPFLGSYRRDGKDGFHNMMVLFGRLYP